VNWFLTIAGILSILVAAVHSILGERKISSHMRQSGGIPTNGAGFLRESHVRILWASWHLVSVFGLALAGCLFFLAVSDLLRSHEVFLISTIASGMLAGSAFVFIGTNGKHLGWVGLLCIAILTLLGLVF